MWIVALFACTTPAPPATIVPAGEPLPQGLFVVAFDFEFPVVGSPWSITPGGTAERTSGALVVQIDEIWREPSPYFGDCPVSVRLEGIPTADPAVYAMVAIEVDDPCATHAYGVDEAFVVRFVRREQALTWLHESMSVSRRTLEAREAGLAEDLGPASDWFAFWGPEVDVLWPLGHVFTQVP